ncbi:MAG: SUMF1/EgtB/PvdO family nonheme iron enzyme [Marinilabiliales bacterium]|nr:SUMF1/EgtB/PvdO family nonheme iron enzyme [Marinilabiliales bacterium]
MGPSDQDPLRAMNSLSKTVTVEAFWMDQTEITNNKYRQFTYWVRDSILRTKLGEEGIEGYEFFRTDEEGNVIEPNVLNWEEEIDFEDENIQSRRRRPCIILLKRDLTPTSSGTPGF